MRQPRNPFKLRASEQIIPDITFLKLFGSKTLELISEDNFEKVTIFQSAAGGGKTSLFRVFTPSALHILQRFKTDEDYEDLYRRMVALHSLSDDGPDLLAVMLTCAQSYAMLDNLNLDPAQKERLLYSLLNVRILLAALRGTLVLCDLSFPSGLKDIHINKTSHIQFPEWLSVPVPCSGKELFDWAVNIEESICEAIDSFDPLPRKSLRGHDTLYSFQLLVPSAITYQGQPVVSRILIMLDDVHKLTQTQRQKLLDKLLSLRWPVSIWIAERLEALTPSELLSEGAIAGRDYETIKLEDYWGNKQHRFKDLVTSIADKRSRVAPDFEFGSYSGYLETTTDNTVLQEHYDDACQVISSRLVSKFSSNTIYKDWLETTQKSIGTSRENAVKWRALEIMIERKMAEAQLPLPMPLSPEEFESRSSSVNPPAELFIMEEFGIPYYFGISDLASLASSNIEQFLDFAGELFERIISSALLKNQTTLSPEIQQDILIKVVERRWHEIPRRVLNGRDVQKLLSAIREFARSETYRPSAPYSPGVTGIGFSEQNRKKLIDPEIHKIHPEYRYVAELLSSCISSNLLEPRWIIQGKKGQQWLVLYLNRWLCLQAKLPLQYGGWRPVTLDRLHKWLGKGVQDYKKKVMF